MLIAGDEWLIYIYIYFYKGPKLLLEYINPYAQGRFENNVSIVIFKLNSRIDILGRFYVVYVVQKNATEPLWW